MTFEWIIHNIPVWNSWIALATFWAPLVLCAYGYTMRDISAYRSDLSERMEEEKKEPNFYRPKLTVGTLIGHAFVTICPIINFCAAIFDVAPQVFSDFFTWIGKVLDIPLVPRRNK